MKLQICNVYRLANGEKVLIDGQTTVSKHTYFRGTTQAGEVLSYDENGNRQAIGVVKPGKDIVERVPGEDDSNFKIMSVGARWLTPGDRVWEVIAICRDEKFPIIANELLPDDSFHVSIKRFDWNGRPHDGSASILDRRIA